MLNQYTIHFDGSCGPTNPGGTAAYGFTLHYNGELIKEEAGVLGTGEGMTNNYAEFMALYKALVAVHMYVGDRKGATLLHVYGDSQFAINMMNGKWKGTEGKPYYEPMVWCKNWAKQLRKANFITDFNWIPRARNEHCDRLSKDHYLTKAQKEATIAK